MKAKIFAITNAMRAAGVEAYRQARIDCLSEVEMVEEIFCAMSNYYIAEASGDLDGVVH